MSETETIEVLPDVARVSEGLRDTGYEFNTAIADIIDNSIAAGATLVDVRMGADYEGTLVISVGDDGCGMDRAGLIDAMKYGSKRREDPASLGKFGLGLKTASTAFCRRLVVVTRPAAAALPLRAAWDLDAMVRSNRWGLELAAPAVPEAQLLDEVAKGGPGTLVVWEKIDRMLTDFKKPDGKPLKKAIARLEDSLRQHIAMVYQRFLDPGDPRARTLAITLNRIPVEAWDPFCLIETGQPVFEQSIPVETEGGRRTSFSVRAFILPRKEEFTREDARVAARISNERQGVYVYRENRMIHGPDWLGMFRQEPHFSLLRVELSFDHRLDDAFQVDIKKSRILLNEQLYELLRDRLLAAPRREAEMRYRKGAAGAAKNAAVLLHAASGNAIQQKAGALKVATVTGVDADRGEVDLANNAGQARAKLRIVVSEEPRPVHISTAASLDNGVLWEAALVNGSAGVTLNTGHPYYTKAYLPNKASSAVIQALDFLLWGLAQAELNNVSDENREAFEEFRIEVSRNLKKLVADLPDAVEGETG